MTCSTCRNFHPDDNHETGECRARSPKALAHITQDEAGGPVVHSAAVWPVLGSSEWCGEWSARHGPRLMGDDVVSSENYARVPELTPGA